MSTPLWVEYALPLFETPGRRYASPGVLARALDLKTGSSPALDAIDRALVALTDGTLEDDHGGIANALAVFLPPQEGKSQKCSRRFPEWGLDHNPELRFVVVSYEQDTALRWGRDIKQDVALQPCRTGGDCREACGGLHISIRRDSSAAGRWETPQGGGVYCVGVGGPLTGRPVDVLIVDDPVKDRAAAESQKIRNSTWDWWESVALTRLAPDAKVVLIQTRWHEDDLAGRIFSRPSPLKWRKIVIPAIRTDEADPSLYDGTELVSVRRREPGYFLNLRASMSAYAFSGIYQQTPTAPEGNFFRRATFRYWRTLAPWADGRERIDLEGRPFTLQDCWRFVTMDFAASTKVSADYTVAACWAISPEGDLVLLDRVRGRVPDHQHFAMAAPLLHRWQAAQVWVESNWWSQAFVSDARDRGVPVALVKADKDKLTRAIPAAGRVHAGKVWFPAGAPWLDEWCDELAAFPSGTHDDQVDVLAYAAKIVVNEWVPATDTPRPGLTPWEQSIREAHRAATGDGDKPFNAFDVPF